MLQHRELHIPCTGDKTQCFLFARLPPFSLALWHCACCCAAAVPSSLAVRVCAWHCLMEVYSMWFSEGLHIVVSLFVSPFCLFVLMWLYIAASPLCFYDNRGCWASLWICLLSLLLLFDCFGMSLCIYRAFWFPLMCHSRCVFISLYLILLDYIFFRLLHCGGIVKRHTLRIIYSYCNPHNADISLVPRQNTASALLHIFTAMFIRVTVECVMTRLKSYCITKGKLP